MRRPLAIGIITLSLLTASAPAFAQFVQQGPKLVGTGGIPISRQGAAVAISADGNTAIAGDPNDGGAGAVWIFTRTGSTWTQQGPKLVATDVPPGGGLGRSVAISADGNTAIAGATLFYSACIFVRNGSTWTQQGPRLFDLPMFESVNAVAMSADGNTAVIGYPRDNGDVGALRAFTRSGTTWSQQGPKLVATGGEIATPGLGVSTAMSADGNTVVAGGQWDGVWVFTRSATTWSQEAGPLTPTDAPGFLIGFGRAVALSADGATAAIGGASDHEGGATRIFTRSGSTWTQQGPKLVGTGADSSGTLQGLGVSLSGNGNVLLVGGPGDGYSPPPVPCPDCVGSTMGAAWVFRRVGTAWFQSGPKLVGAGASSNSQQGRAIAISADGLTAIVGGSSDSPSGAAWIFSNVPTELRRAGDHDGDGLSEITVYNTASGVWSSLTSAEGYTSATNIGWGGTDYTAVPGDYDGDGRTDLGVYHESSGNWYVLLSGANFTTTVSASAGGAGWLPVPGDYDGDGLTDFVVYNTTSGQWYGLESSTGYTPTFNISWGGDGYQAVPGDYDGDGKVDLGVYNTTSGVWSVLLSSTSYTTVLSQSVGGTGWTPVPADYDGDRKADFVVYNPSTGQWYGLQSSTSYTTTINVNWGGTGYAPVKGDYDGDGKADLAVYVETTGSWYVLLSGANYTTTMSTNWGGVGYTAVPQFP